MRNLLLAGAAALALLLAPATAASAESLHSYIPAETIHGTVDHAVVSPGETVTYTAPASRFGADEAVTASVRGVSGASIALVSTVSDRSWQMAARPDGSLTFSIRMPKDGRGDYTLRVAGSSGAALDTFTITVVPVDASDRPATGSGTDGDRLASTGSTVAIYAISAVAVVLVIAGIVLLIVRRRRTTPDRSA